MNSNVEISTDLCALNRFDTNDCLLSLPIECFPSQSPSSEFEWRQPLHLEKAIKTSPEETNYLTKQLADALNQNKTLKELTVFHLDLIEKQKQLISKQDAMYHVLKKENDNLKAKMTEDNRETEHNEKHSNHTLTRTTTSSASPVQVPDDTSNLLIHDHKIAYKKIKVLQPGTRSDLGPVMAQVFEGQNLKTGAHPDFDNFQTLDNKHVLYKKEVKAKNCSLALNTTLGNRNLKKEASFIGSMIESETIQPKCSFTKQDQGFEAYSEDKKKKIINISGMSQNTLLVLPKQATESTKFQSSTIKPKKVETTVIVHEPDLDIVKTETEFTLSIYNDTSNDKSICQSPSDKASISHSLNADEFQELLTLESASSNVDFLNNLTQPMKKIPKITKKVTSTSSKVSWSKDMDAKNVFGRRCGKKRAFCLSGLRKKHVSNNASKKKFVKRNLVDQEKKISPAPGQKTSKPFLSLVGDPDLSWYIGLDPGLKHEDVDQTSFSQNSTVEVPKWRKQIYIWCYVLHGTENLDDDVFKRRHKKHEARERQVQRWHRQRVQEQLRLENRQRRQRMLQHNSPVEPAPIYTLWQRPQAEAQYIEITTEIPVSAFGEHLPRLPESDFKAPWVRTPKPLKRSRHSIDPP